MDIRSSFERMEMSKDNVGKLEILEKLHKPFQVW